MRGGLRSFKKAAAQSENSTEYTINIRCIGTDSSLSNLKVSGSNTFGEDEYAMSP